jgi:hypothetical protein
MLPSLLAARHPVGLLDVLHVLDDHDDSRDDQEERYGRQDLHCDFPERQAGDGERDEERDHFVSSPASGGMVIGAPTGVLLLLRGG